MAARSARQWQELRWSARVHLARRRSRRPRRPVAEPSAGGSLQPLLVDMIEGRVGSTLLMQLLGTSPDIVFDRVYPFENRYLHCLLSAVRHVDQPLRDRPEPGAAGVLDGSGGSLPFVPLSLDPVQLRDGAVSALWAAFCAATEAFSGAPGRFYAEKALADDVDLLVRSGVAARVVHLVRDPRDVVASVRAFDAKRGYPGFGRRPGDDDAADLDRLLRGMRDRFDAFERRAGLVDSRLVRYEDLVRDLAGVAAELGTWLGAALDPAAVERGRAAMARHMTSADPESSIGRWRRDLDPADADRVVEVLGPAMRRHGYLG